jgi:hypothetical protein
MKYIVLTVTLLFLAISANTAAAQFVNEIPRTGDWTGSIVKTDLNQKKIFGNVAFKMNHAYEVSFTSFGGQAYNQNMYTNTMLFGFSDRLNARLDLSMAHSPFGNGLMTQGNDMRFMVRNAELNYRISDKSHVSVSFSQMPYGSGGPYDRYGFGNHSFRSRNNPWSAAGNPFSPYY